MTGHKGEEKIIVFFPPTGTRLGIKSVKEFIEIMLNSEIYHAIIVTQSDSTTQARNALERAGEEILEHPILFEQFREDEFADKYNETYSRT